MTATVIQFGPINTAAGQLMLPCISWIVFSAGLSLYAGSRFPTPARRMTSASCSSSRIRPTVAMSRAGDRSVGLKRCPTLPTAAR